MKMDEAKPPNKKGLRKWRVLCTACGHDWWSTHEDAAGVDESLKPLSKEYYKLARSDESSINKDIRGSRTSRYSRRGRVKPGAVPPRIVGYAPRARKYNKSATKKG
jgi:hypothetical protein